MFQFSNSLNISKSIKVSIPIPVNFVVFGSGTNNIATSNDGISWTPITNSALFGRGASMSYSLDNNGSPLWLSGFGASNTNKFAKSTDGTTWTSFDTTTFATCYTVAYGKDNLGGNLWAACGATANTFAYSTDGTNWVGGGNQGVFPSNTYDIAYGKDFSGNGLWVAVGQGASHSIAKSVDGKTWVGSGKTIFTTQGFSVAFGKDISENNLWVALGAGTNSIASSSDGSTWTGRSLTNNIFTIGYNAAFGKDSSGNKLWVAVGSGANTIATSTNGTTWTGLGNTIITTIGYGITYGNGIWVATGSGANTIATSPNGTTWTGLGNTIINGTGWTSYFKPVVDISNLPVPYSLAFGPGTTSISKTTDTGNTYTSVATNSLFSGYGYSGATDGSGLWIGTGSGTNTLAKSTDYGNTWSAIGGAFAAAGFRLVYANNIFVVAGGSGNNSGVNIIVLNSSGTITNTYTGYFGTFAWSVGFFKGKWYVGGTGGGSTSGFSATTPLLVSTDNTATSWTKPSTSGLDTAINHIATNNTHIIISGTSSQSTMISTDGSSWTACQIGGVKLFTTGLSAKYANGVWIATGTASSGTNSIARSSNNGATWTYVGTGIFSSAAGVVFCGNDTWIAAGTGATFNTAKSTNNGASWVGISNTNATSIYDIVN